MRKRVDVIPLEQLADPPPLWIRVYYLLRAPAASGQSLFGGTQGFKVGVPLVLLEMLIIAIALALVDIISPLPSWLTVLIGVPLTVFIEFIPLLHIVLAKSEWNTPYLKTISIYVVLFALSFLIYEFFFF
jgi:hypothetical protein